MARRKLDALLGDQIEEGIVGRGRDSAHRRHHALVVLRPGDRRNIGEGVADRLRFGAHAAGDDDAAVLAERRADGVERLLLGAVEKAAGVDDHRIAPLWVFENSYPSARRRVRIRSESTNALGHPSDTNEMRGAADMVAALPRLAAFANPGLANAPRRARAGTFGLDRAPMRKFSIGLMSLALLAGAARAAEPPRTIGDFGNAMNAIAERLDLQLGQRQKAADAAGAQRLALLAAMIRRASAETPLRRTSRHRR